MDRAGVILARINRRRGWATGFGLATLAAFLLFGLSDLVETRTGAWWRPWWLAAWKCANAVIIAAILWRFVRGRGPRRNQSS